MAKKKEYVDEDIYEEKGDEEEYYYEEYEVSDICFCDVENKIITIRADILFDRPDIAYMNNFKITRRAYFRIVELITSDYQLIIENYPEFVLYLLDIKYSCLSEENENELSNEEKEEIMLNKIEEILKDEELIEFIDNYVEENYTLKLNSFINTHDKNKEYAITDENNKVYLKTSMFSRLLVPIICETSLRDKDIYNIFIKIMKLFSNGTKREINKLYKFIELRVQRTIYSDKVIWAFLTSHSVDPQLTIRNFNRAVITSVLTKLSHNKSVVSFLDVVIREKLHYAFIYNYPISIKSIKNTEQEIEEREKLEVFMLKHDKGELLLHKISIENEVKEVDIPKEYEYLLNVHNPYTNKILLLYYSDDFNPIFADEEQRVKLILKLRGILIKQGFKLLPDVLISDMITNEKRFNNRRKLSEEVIGNKKYKGVLRKYSDVYNLFEKNNPVLQLITMKNNKLVINDEELQLPLNELANEILDLI